LTDLEPADYRFLIGISRKAIERCLLGGKRINIPPDIADKFFQKRGVFVALRLESPPSLRGCIGRPYPVEPLIHATINSAIEAATCDPRFQPLVPDELDRVIVELSVLTVPVRLKASRPLEYPKMIRVGRDGLIIARGPHKGLLLPQVAVEHAMDSEDFLSQCCLKAALPPDAWLLDDTEVYCFQATIAEEKRPGGEIDLKELSLL